VGGGDVRLRAREEEAEGGGGGPGEGRGRRSRRGVATRPTASKRQDHNSRHALLWPAPQARADAEGLRPLGSPTIEGSRPSAGASVESKITCVSSQVFPQPHAQVAKFSSSPTYTNTPSSLPPPPTSPSMPHSSSPSFFRPFL
jgi:hypothetical protein